MSGDFTKINSNDLDLEFFGDVFDLLNTLPDAWVVVCGQRSMEESNKLYVQYKLHKGVKAAPGGLSAHNYGLAIDVMLDSDTIKPGIQPLWDTDDPAWQRLIAAIWKHPRLHSGKSFADYPHIEKLDWKDYVAWRKNHEDNMRMLFKQYPELEKVA